MSLPDYYRLRQFAAIGKFLKAYFLYDLTMNLGDIPVSDALKGLTNVTPKYDTQKQVFQQILTYLEQANTEMGSLKTTNYVLASDFYYGNDLSKWQKAVNAFKLRVLIQLSNKEADADLAIKTKFAETISNPTNSCPYSFTPLRTTARITAFKPGQSPPPVSTPKRQ